MKAQLDVYVPIPKRWAFRAFENGPVQEAMLKEIASLTDKIHLRRYDDKLDSIAIEFLADESIDSFVGSNWRKPGTLLDYCFLRLRSDIAFNEEDVQPWAKAFDDLPRTQAARMYCDSAVDLLYKRWFDIAICANIASPGSLGFDSCLLAVDGKFYRLREGGNTNFDFAFEDTMKLGWPPLERMPLPKVWSWLSAIPGFEGACSESPLGRAIGAISYLINPRFGDENELALVWALLGLEALYGESNVGMRAQLLQKSEAFLGKRLSQTKQYGWMYDYRSRLLHGDIDLAFRHNELNATPEYERFQDDLSKAEALALAMLLSTLQEMCRRNKFELSFSHVVDAER